MHHLESDGAPKERADGEKIEDRKLDDVVEGAAADETEDAADDFENEDAEAADGDEGDDADEEEGERELEEGEEYCPICERRNSPGACETCEHYFGNCWDGLILWSRDVREFEAVWGELEELIHEEVGPRHEEPIEFCASVAVQQQLPARFLDPQILEMGTAHALEILADFSLGDMFETEGMLSGSGYSLYLESMKPIDTLVAQIRAVIAAVRKALQ